MIPLTLGSNTITAQVIAQDGKTNNTYTLTVIRDRGRQDFKFSLTPVTDYGADDISLEATVSSGLHITYTSSDITKAIILNNKSIHAVGVGATTITATVDVDLKNNYYPVAPQSQTLTINKGSQTIKNDGIPEFKKGQLPFDLKTKIYSNFGLKVSFKVEDDMMAVIKDGLITPLQIGKTAIIAIADSNEYYKPKTETFDITIQDDVNNEIVVHQMVTPNGDGVNDFFLIEGLQDFKNNAVKIVNRNGIIVFDTKGYDNEKVKFDGHIADSADYLPAGTYFYIIDYTNATGVHKRKSDYITLKY